MNAKDARAMTDKALTELYDILINRAYFDIEAAASEGVDRATFLVLDELAGGFAEHFAGLGYATREEPAYQSKRDSRLWREVRVFW